jgi:hypothetical protein
MRDDRRELPDVADRPRSVNVLKPLLMVLVVATGLVVAGGTPAYACSCEANVPIEKLLAESDAAFVGVYTGSDSLPLEVARLNANREVMNHFQVERSVKGDLGAEVDVGSSGSGASCGLELSAGERTGLVVGRDDTGGWISGLCSQVPPEELASFAASGSTGSGAGADWGFIVFAGVLLLAIPLAFVVGGARRRD